MRVDVYDESGNRYTISLEGRVTRKNALRILDIIELLGGMPGIPTQTKKQEFMSTFDKVKFLVQNEFPMVWFSAKEVKVIYENKIGESIGLSVISTYLGRLSDRDLIIKKKKGNRVFYKLFSKGIKNLLQPTDF